MRRLTVRFEWRLWIPWAIIAGLIFLLIWFGFEQIPKTDTRDAFLGNLLATILGLVVGIPIAMKINSYQKAVEEAREAASRRQEREARQKRILGLVWSELVLAHNTLVEVIKSQGVRPYEVTIAGLKMDLWIALADGGELHWIEDLKILDALAKAYFYVRRVIFFEDKFFDLAFKMSVSVGGRSTISGEVVAGAAAHLRPEALTAIKAALLLLRPHAESLGYSAAVLAEDDVAAEATAAS